MTAPQLAIAVEPAAVTLAADRRLAIRYLRPRQAVPPPYEELTDSGRAEVDRIVKLVLQVRLEAFHAGALAGLAVRQ